MTDAFTPARSDAIRAGLVAEVGMTPPRRRRMLWAATLVVGGALAGAGVSTAAFAATGVLEMRPVIAQPSGQPVPDLPDAVPAPAGITPGAPIVSLLGEPVTAAVPGTSEVPLTERPDGATHARVVVTATHAGGLSFGTDPGGNNTSISGGVESATWFDFPLDGTVRALYIDASDGFEGTVVVQFVSYLPTMLGVNARGETYGVGESVGSPDLVLAEGTAPDGSRVTGYVRASDLAWSSPDHHGMPSSPEEALAWQTETQEKYPNGWTLALFESDGVTEIGRFQVGG